VKLTGLQLVKKFPAFHGTRRLITSLTSVRHLSLSWARPIQSIYPHPTSWSSILKLSTHLHLGLRSGLFPSGFPTKTLYTHLSSQIHPNIIHPSTPRSPQWSLSLRFPHQDPIHPLQASRLVGYVGIYQTASLLIVTHTLPMIILPCHLIFYNFNF
jgi:hypothetical protein